MSATDALDDVEDALVEHADDGIDFDGLVVEPADGGYRWETPGEQLTVSEDLLRERAGDPYATNWYYWEHVVEGHDTPRRAFLRWLEGADDLDVPERYDELRGGHTNSWGELAVTAVLSEGGRRRYEVRHEDDRGEDVEAYTDPLEARHLVKHDDQGRYRPLSTAPTLPHGWAFVDLDGSDLVQTVDYVYPATVSNWHRERVGERSEPTENSSGENRPASRAGERGEATDGASGDDGAASREGNLDIDHWDEVADRQSGIYEIVEQLDDDALEWAAEACCVDSQCVKRREWDKSEDEELDVPRGDGEFPCREPCSVFIAAARKFTTLEREETREYTFELTPAEKEQLEDVVDAVADGRVDEIREADVNEGANRYRARFLRAKRMDEHGLSGTPTYPEDHE